MIFKVTLLFASFFGIAFCAPKGIFSTALGTVNGSFSAFTHFMHEEMEPRMKRIESSIGRIGEDMDAKFGDLREQMMGFAGIMRGNKLPGDLVIDVTPEKNGNTNTDDVNEGSSHVMETVSNGGQNPIGGLFSMVGNVPQMVGNVPQMVGNVPSMIGNAPQGFQSLISKRKSFNSRAPKVQKEEYNPDVVIIEDEKDSQ